jgi:signal transduction histidine kinase
MNDPWLLVLGPDGRIVQTGGAPREWLGMRIGDAVGVPGPVVDAARELIVAARTSTTWLSRRYVQTATRAYELLVVEAVPLRRSLTNVRDILTRTTELLLEQARAIRVSLQVSTDPEMPSELVVDGEKIAWGVASLVGTALRHLAQQSREKGTVRVQARYLAGTEEVVVVVRDNGPGIPADRLLGILEPSEEQALPSALALVMLRDVVAAHGGRIKIDSSTDRADHGTTVSLFLPAAPGSLA